jgi:hypothetical protein
MTNSSIEASSTGLKLSYVRFISDSAPGFVVILLIILGVGDEFEPWWTNHQELKVLVATLCFLLATPVGLALNAVSYFVLGHIQSEINRICFLSNRWPVRDTRRSFMVEKSQVHFGFTADDWDERNDVYGELLETYRPDLAFRIEPLRGLKRFARAMSFLSFIYFVYLRVEGGFTIVVAAVAAHWLLAVIRRLGVRHDFDVPRVPELWIVIVFSLVALSVFLILIGRTCESWAFEIRQTCSLAIALVGIILAGMVDFYERATIAMYLHIECPSATRDSLSEISEALKQSAKDIGSVSS